MLKNVFKEFLFAKHILVGDQPIAPSAEIMVETNEPARVGAQVFETIFSLAKLLNIKITSGHELASPDMIAFAQKQLGVNVPEPFYRGFPQSVRELTPEQLLFDQLVHYTITYGFGRFDGPAGHSILEDNFERLAFNEQNPPKEFRIVSESDAIVELKNSVDALLSGSRPMSETQFNVVKEFVIEFKPTIEKCASKDAAVKLLLETRDPQFGRFLALSDVLRVVEQINFTKYGKESLKKLNFKNQDRKFVARLIDLVFECGVCNVKDCFEKKALWCGLLHHIHYQPETDAAKEFVAKMRGKSNESVYSEFERNMTNGDVPAAVDSLVKGKGVGALLRQLDYVVSRCGDDEAKILAVAAKIRTSNPILLLQLIDHYAHYKPQRGVPRTFKFTKFNKLRVHNESKNEATRRKSFIDPKAIKILGDALLDNLKALFAGKLGKVYVDPALPRVGLPIQETTASGGFGVLPRGSRIPLPKGKKIRAFTYWEKVNDIDLSCFGLDEKGGQTEFSWRTMWNRQSDALTFSGDETNGFYGGSEYFDLDVDAIRKMFPNMRYMVFCNNIFTFSCPSFDKCFCKAGFMLRDLLDSGQVYEPKTVQTSFLITGGSRFAYLFGVDLATKEFVWLNVMRDSAANVAGTTSMKFLLDYLDAAKVLSVNDLLKMAATKVVDDPSDADLVFTDRTVKLIQPNDGKDDKAPTPSRTAIVDAFAKLFAKTDFDAAKTDGEIELQPNAVVARSSDVELFVALLNGDFDAIMNGPTAEKVAETPLTDLDPNASQAKANADNGNAANRSADAQRAKETQDAVDSLLQRLRDITDR